MSASMALVYVYEIFAISVWSLIAFRPFPRIALTKGTGTKEGSETAGGSEAELPLQPKKADSADRSGEEEDAEEEKNGSGTFRFCTHASYSPLL